MNRLTKLDVCIISVGKIQSCLKLPPILTMKSSAIDRAA